MRIKGVGICLALSVFMLTSCGQENAAASSQTSIEPVPGPKGDKGEDGRSVLTGEGAPADSLGTDGDSYIDVSTFGFYTKENGAWALKGTIKGSDGLDGLDGQNGKDGKNGASVLSGTSAPSDDVGVNGDFYIDTTNYDFYKKTEGAWEKVGNIQGQKGEKGDAGETYFANTFLPANGGYLYSDKGSYKQGETIALTAVAQKGYTLEGIEVIKDGDVFVYGQDSGLSNLLANGIEEKENGYVFRPLFFKTDATFEVAASEIAQIGAKGDGTYNLRESTYGTSTNGVTFGSSGNAIKIIGQKDSEGKPATTIYVSEESSFFALDYLSLENVNVILSEDYKDGNSIFKFDALYASLKNVTITVDKEVSAALNFKTGNFAMKDVKIKANDSLLTTAVLFSETEGTKLANVAIDTFKVSTVKGTNYGVYAGSIFKSYWDALGFKFAIKNSSFGEEATPIGEMWSHFRQKDPISTRFGIDSALYKKNMKTSSFAMENTAIYSKLSTTYRDDVYEPSPALITFRMMQTEDDSDYTQRRVFADILLDIRSATFNGTAITSDKVAFGKDGSVPLTTLYSFDSSEDTWYGLRTLFSYNAVFPYGQVDGVEAKLALQGNYPQ